MTEHGYDPAVEDLAELFIDDPPQRSQLLKRGYTPAQLGDLQRQLAQHIQDAIEDWFSQFDEETNDADRAHHG